MKQLKINKQITIRETKSFDAYLQDISKIPLISTEEEVELAKQIKNGDTDALRKLTKANLRFVVSVAKQYQNQGLSLPDLINEGNLGLITAAQRFDETRGFKFISYAVWWIRQAILKALSEQVRVVRLPLNRIGAINNMKKSFSALEQEFEREPSNDELAEATGVSVKDINVTISVDHRTASLDAPLLKSSFDAQDLHGVIEDISSPKTDGELVNESLSQEIKRVLSRLPPLEAEVIELVFGLNGKQSMSLLQIGEKHDLTRERIRQIKDKGIRRLKRLSVSQLLRGFLG
ncbi:RNA polymerase subunit sigma [Candidatus Wolfebacteria bacterium]|nr:MAG: RNA polymerase subunit sigma [Candidatus Wolfebacteria bacterium]